MPYREIIKEPETPPYRDAGILGKLACKIGKHDIYYRTPKGKYIREDIGTRGDEDVPYPMYAVYDIDTICAVCKRNWKTIVRSYNRNYLLQFAEDEIHAIIMELGWG